MRVLSKTVAAERARWLSELADAIDEAQRIAWRIGFVEGPNREAMDLYVRLELARAEIDSLRASEWTHSAEELPPEWIEFLSDSGLAPTKA